MSYSLVHTKNEQNGGKKLGENVYIDHLPSDSDIFVFFYPSESFLTESLQTRLRSFGKNSGDKIFVNIGRIGDDNYSRIVKDFDVKNLPVIIVTGKESIASIKDQNNSNTVYVKYEGKSLKDDERAMSFVEKSVNLFIDGNIIEAQKQTQQLLISTMFSTVKNFFFRIFQNFQEISIGLLDGTFKITFKG